MQSKEKFYTHAYIMEKYAKLSKNEKIDVLYEAIDIMHQYNGRSRFTCIAMAMGYENFLGLYDTWTYRSK